MSVSKKTVLGMLPKAVAGLRFPQLFLVTLALFLADLLIPDLIPFIDEILLGLASLLLASWKRKPGPPTAGDGPVIDIDIEPEK